MLFFPGDLPMPPKVADSMGSGRRVERQGGRWRWRTANGARLNGAGDFWNLPSGYG